MLSRVVKGGYFGFFGAVTKTEDFSLWFTRKSLNTYRLFDTDSQGYIGALTTLYYVGSGESGIANGAEQTAHDWP